ncbi:MAG TPA: GIY-YIG nuclease family protein [Chitinophagaceae bacterium]
MNRGYFYMMTNKHNTVLYCGATTDLYKRVQEHRSGVFDNSFTLRYNIDKLVYFESFTEACDAFLREKQVKAGSRRRKLDLIEKTNPEWKDLFDLLKDYQGEELIRIKRLLR